MILYNIFHSFLYLTFLYLMAIVIVVSLMIMSSAVAEKGLNINEDRAFIKDKTVDSESTAYCHLTVKNSNVWKLYKVPSRVINPWKHKRTSNKIADGNPNNL